MPPLAPHLLLPFEDHQMLGQRHPTQALHVSFGSAGPATLTRVVHRLSVGKSSFTCLESRISFTRLKAFDVNSMSMIRCRGTNLDQELYTTAISTLGLCLLSADSAGI